MNPVDIDIKLSNNLCNSQGGLPMDNEENIQNGISCDETEELSEADTEALVHQIAGHSRTGVLKHRLGYVLKAVQKMPLGKREVNFYKQVFNKNENNVDETSRLLRTMIPIYRGVAVIKDSNNSKTEYLMLDDIVQGLLCPSIIDIKIGKQTWDPLAPKAKIEHEKKKYTGTKNKFGISITGMQFYDIKEQKTIKCEKEWGKTVTESSMYSALRNFLNSKVNAEKFIADAILSKLKRILEFFEFQKEYLFYASSLLIAYDGKYIQDNVCSKALSTVAEESDEQLEKWLRVRMIDFAHVFPANGSVDSNYLFGLKNTINIFSNILQSQTNISFSNEDGGNEIKDF